MVIKLAQQIDRVPSMLVPLDNEQELRFQHLMEQVTLVDVHQHPMVLPEEMEELTAYVRSNEYSWGYQAVQHGGWTAVTTANFYRGLINTPDLSMVDFEDVLQEVALMLSDLARQEKIVKVGNADGIEAVRNNRSPESLVHNVDRSTSVSEHLFRVCRLHLRVLHVELIDQLTNDLFD